MFSPPNEMISTGDKQHFIFEKRTKKYFYLFFSFMNINYGGKGQKEKQEIIFFCPSAVFYMQLTNKTTIWAVLKVCYCFLSHPFFFHFHFVGG